MTNILTRISRRRSYWLSLLLLSLALLGTALYYQYNLDYPPCVLCIQVRIGVLAIGTFSLLAMLLPVRRWLTLVLHLIMTGMLAFLAERSWVLLGTERGWIEGTCTMDAGLPDWFALDRWFPSLFEVMVPCGYTPELLFGITMAEALLGLFVAGTLVSALLTFAALRGPGPRRSYTAV